MSNNRRVVSGVSLVIVLALAGCLDGTGGATSASRDTPRAGQAVERDVEAPEVFSKRDSALWDGRPSLGGVWVAHPDARTPERVIIRNAETGRETIGALFKRERMNPGPIFQVSADAAAAVGMLAGAPTGIEVIALRTEETGPAPVAAAAANTATVETTSDVAEAPAAAAAEPAPLQSANAEGAVADTETTIAMPEDETAAPRGGFFSRIFGRRGSQAAVADAAAIETQVLDGGPIETATAAPDAPLRMPTPVTPQASTAAPVAAAQAAASTLAQPFIQLGIFSVEANATRAQKLARDAGLSARVITGQTQGNQFWRVTVGPASTTAEQRDLLGRVKALGFNDAYTVRR